MFIYSDRQSDYSADFNKMLVYVTDRVTRITEPIPIVFNDARFHGNLPDTVLVFLLPYYSRYLEIQDKVENLRGILLSIDHDLNDDACRNFNSFNGGKGE
jgi:hypothetical protein